MQILPKQNVTDGNIPTLNPIYYCTISPSVLLFPTFIFSLLVDENMNSKSFFFFPEVIHISVFYPTEQRFPTFLVPGTGFMEHNFPTKRGGIEG